jgi:hypothetical protein
MKGTTVDCSSMNLRLTKAKYSNIIYTFPALGRPPVLKDSFTRRKFFVVLMVFQFFNVVPTVQHLSDVIGVSFLQR